MRGAPFGVPDARASGRVCAHAHPTSALAPGTGLLRASVGDPAPTQAPGPQPGGRSYLSGARALQTPRGPQPRWENESSLRPAGACPKHLHACFHARAKSDASRQSGQQMTFLAAEREKSGGGGKGQWGGFGGERGKGAVVSRGKKTNRPASLPLLSLDCLSQEINLTTASPHQACFCLFDLDHR